MPPKAARSEVVTGGTGYGGYPAHVSPDPPGDPPGSIEQIARQRAAARDRRDWSEADRLRREIETAGWKVIDQGIEFRLEPGVAADVEQDGRLLYGSSISVPSRLDQPTTDAASVVMIAPHRREALQEAVSVLRRAIPEGTSLVIVANDPDATVTEALGELETAGSAEPIWLGGSLAPSAAANAGLRRAAGSVVILLDEHTLPTGDIVGPLVDALTDPSVAVAGAAGLDSADMRRWEPAGPGIVDALAWGALAFRREDLMARGPLDERFLLRRSLGPWWSLILRDEGADAPPRRAIAVSLPLDVEPASEADDRSLARAIKRDFYRLIDRFGHRYDLLRSPEPRGRAANGHR